MTPGRKTAIALGGVALVVCAGIYLGSRSGQPVAAHSSPGPDTSSYSITGEAVVKLEAGQLSSIKIEPIDTYSFPVETEAVGSIDYDEDHAVQVFSPYQGRILSATANLGDKVERGQPLYTVDSPDLIQAESTLIGAAGTFALTSKELARAKGLYGTNGVSEREIEQVASDQQTAEGALKAARDAVRLFGKTDEEIDQIVASRKIDPALVMRSPLSGQVTARNASAGLLVQPGSGSPPYVVADLSRKWMVASVSEANTPLLHAGQEVRASVNAYPGREFEGKISRMASAVDPSTHRTMVRCEMPDPRDELRPGMLASFVIRVRDPVESVAVPMTGVVRNGDGTMAAWTTSDRRTFFQRILKIGLQRDGRYQVLDGLRPGELAVSEGAIFLSNLLQAPPSD